LNPLLKSVRHGTGAYRSAERIGPVTWPFYDLILIRRGSAVFEVGGEVLACGKADALLCPPGHRIEGTAGEEGCTIWVQHFHALPGAQRDPSLNLPDRPSLRRSPLADPWRAALLQRLATIQQEKRPGQAAEFSHVLALLLIDLEESPEGVAPQQSSKDRTLAQVRERIAESDFPLPSVEALAAEVGWSGSHLRQCFRRRFGQGIGSHLSEIRMEEARRLVRETTAPLKEIARQTGYSETASFHRAFVRAHGHTPGQYRARNRGMI